MKIRKAEINDVPEILDILKQTKLYDETWDSKENILGMIKKDPESVIVAAEKNSIIGNLFFVSYGSKVAYLFRVAVKENYRNKGVGTKLINYAQELAKKRGIKEIGLYVTSKNKTLTDFYKKRNYKTTNKKWIYFWKDLDKDK